MSTILIQNATMLVTMDAERREIGDGALLVGNHRIEWVGLTSDLQPELAAQDQTNGITVMVLCRVNKFIRAM